MLIAGPCCVETEEQIFDIAKKVKAAGANVLRGGAYKPRTSPYDFQGLGEKGLQLLYEAGKENDIQVISEIMDIRDIEKAQKYCDIIQIGARNVQNYALLKEVGKTDKCIMLKNGFSTTIKEFLGSSEYIVSEGNKNIILCLRGVRTFEDSTRNTLDLSLIHVLKGVSEFKIIVDPSHATGKRELVSPIALSAVMAGADGVMVEVHNNPEHALCDGQQSLTTENFCRLSNQMKETLVLRESFI